MDTRTRKHALKLWLLCTLCLPLLWIMQGLQALFGSPERSIGMAFAQDACGNALFGGDPRQSISERTGLALMLGKRWARIVAPVIDHFFGQNHCREEAVQWLKKYRFNAGPPG